MKYEEDIYDLDDDSLNAPDGPGEDDGPDPDRCPKCGEDVTEHFGSLRQICPLPIADND